MKKAAFIILGIFLAGLLSVVITGKGIFELFGQEVNNTLLDIFGIIGVCAVIFALYITIRAWINFFKTK